MTQSIYDKRDASFRNVSAWVILDQDHQTVAKVSIKYGEAVTAYTHWLGTRMTSGRAGGGGYDRNSAAISEGFLKATCVTPEGERSDWQKSDDYRELEARGQVKFEAFVQALTSSDGHYWYQNLEKAGYTVIQAL